MEIFRIDNLSFSYPLAEKDTLKCLDLSIEEGEFVTICGKSGCGKTTLLRHLKPVLTPHGKRTGEICFFGQNIEGLDDRAQAQSIGFVLQSPENQIVTDKVWHELAFGLESLGYDTITVRLRVAEMASFFGIQNWFHKRVTELSGGQKQLLNLAAVMAMNPSVLILDEPTSQLDPIAAVDFLETLAKINREIGTTIILSEHRLEEVVPMSDRIIVMEDGKIIANDDPRTVAMQLLKEENDMFVAMPTPVQIYAGAQSGRSCPLTVREGRSWLNSVLNGRSKEENIQEVSEKKSLLSKFMSVSKVPETGICLDEVWFRYDKEGQDVIKGLDLRIGEGEIFAILGGNGTGKTTTLSIIGDLLKPYRGRVFVRGRQRKKRSSEDVRILMLPQDPQSLFLKKTVEEDLKEVFKKPTEQEKEKIEAMIDRMKIRQVLHQHPYDLSGGEQQRLALAKILLLEPDVLLLDEPTKGLDGFFKQSLAEIMKGMKAEGKTVIMVSHDVEFCARYADTCALFFDGGVVSQRGANEFFAGNHFYTTAANRMARNYFPMAVTTEDVRRRLKQAELVEKGGDEM